MLSLCITDDQATNEQALIRVWAFGYKNDITNFDVFCEC